MQELETKAEIRSDTTTPQRRTGRRQKPVGYLEVYDQNSEGFLGSLVDITPGGLRLLAQNSPVLGRKYTMRLRLPQPILGGDAIRFVAACRWQTACNLPLMRDHFHAGFEIVDITAHDAELLQTMLTSSWFRDWRQLPDYDAVRRESGYPEK